ncbi:MAG: 30S ribosomal protein S19e [Candidatus Woesearchaeota archaeon]
MSTYEEEPRVVIENLGKELKKIIKQPEWAPYVKTGMHKERPPQDKDWFYIRTAAIFRTIALKGPIGVSKLRVKYGGRKNNGVAVEHFYKGSGNIIRKALQELDKAGLTQQAEKGKHKGRIITPKGQSFLSKISRKNGKN